MAFETNKTRLSAEEFELLKLHLKTIDEERLEIARKVLVLGMKPSEVAEEHKVSRQRVSMNTGIVWKAYEFERELAEKRKLVTAAIHISTDKPKSSLVIPAGWEQVTLLAPASLVNQFKQEVQKVIDNQDVRY